MNTIDRVREIVMEIGDGDQRGDEKPLFYDAKVTTEEAHRSAGGWGLDSLDRVEVVMMIEERFGIEVPDQAAEHEQFTTVDGIAAWIDRQQQEA